jgi:trehalose 6-phosphate synthase
MTDSTIWPLLHDQLDKVQFDLNTMAAYRKANKTFADTIVPHLRDGDHIWVHDYHLMLLPLMLRQRAEKLDIKITVGWFLHTPFPESDIFNVLPSKKEILGGILGADMVGFQTDQARCNFLATCSQTLYVPLTRQNEQRLLTSCSNWWSTSTGILCGHREVSAHTFPIGIEPSEFHRRLEKSCVQESLRKIRYSFRATKVILGVDRLDCIKGIPQKLRAFDELLELYPQLVGHVVLLQVTIPSRDDLKAHQDLKDEIQHLVGRINDKYGMSSHLGLNSSSLDMIRDGTILTLA